EQARGFGQRALAGIDTGERQPGRDEQRYHDGAVDCRRNQRRIVQHALDHAAYAHWLTVLTGSSLASMWKRSPGSDGARVVGAKNVARVECGHCSISRISDGASWVIPAICNVLPSMCSSVT